MKNFARIHRTGLGALAAFALVAVPAAGQTAQTLDGRESGGVFGNERNAAAAEVPDGPVQSRAALFTVLAGQGCAVDAARLNEVFSPQGFSYEFVNGVLTEMLADGTATEDAEGRLSVPVAQCPPDRPAPTPRDVVLQRFRDNGCRLGRADLGPLMAELELSREQLRNIVLPLYDAGKLQVERSVATLDAGLCQTPD